jgi:hypothetical protein
MSEIIANDGDIDAGLQQRDGAAVSPMLPAT